MSSGKWLQFFQRRPVEVSRAGTEKRQLPSHANCEAMERREWMPSFAKIFST